MPTPLRIGLVSPYSLTIPGGVQAQVLGLARVLRRMGIEARVLGPCDGPPPETYVTPLGNSIPTAANGSIAPLAPDPSAALRTMRALRDEDFDVLHIHEPLAPGPTMTAMLVARSPVIGTYHAAGDSASYRYATRQLRWLDRHIDVRCVVSKDALELVERYFDVRDYEMMYNGVDLDRYRNTVPTKTDRPTIFFCGRHEPRKGLAVLLESLSQLPADIRCWVASDGPETAQLKARYAGDTRIEWLGRLSEDDKISRLAGASVFCAPSIHGESFGVVLIEAMAAGTPIVSTDLPGYLNVATPDVDALMVAPDDPTALADALRRVLADDALANGLRERAATRAEDFSMETLARRYVAMYERLAVLPRAEWRANRLDEAQPPESGRLRRMLRGTSARRRPPSPHH